MDLNSREYECWHEAGHAAVCILMGGSVELLEFYRNQTLEYRARAVCSVTPTNRPYIACGGFAAEYYLYKSGELNVSEKEFVTTALVNAFPDKRSFFGADYEQENGCWPANFDVRFRDFAINKVAPMIERSDNLVRELANCLLMQERVTQNEIKRIATNHVR